MITLHRITTGKNGKVRVTFEMPTTEHCDALYLVGWFDKRGETVYPMERMGDGKWSVTLELEPGSEFHYRFRAPDGKSPQDSASAPTQFGLNSTFLVGSDRTA